MVESSPEFYLFNSFDEIVNYLTKYKRTFVLISEDVVIDLLTMKVGFVYMVIKIIIILTNLPTRSLRFV